MENLLDKHISSSPSAKVMVLFGGSPYRRDQVIRNLRTIENLSIIGALSEEDGVDLLKNLPQVDIVLIGGRYDAHQRQRIKTHLDRNLPAVELTQPGLEYPYEDDLIYQKIKALVEQ